MDNLNDEELSQWLERRTALAAPPPDWEPNVEIAYTRFQTRQSRSHLLRPYRVLGAVAASLVCVALLSVPSTRALAQQIWSWITVDRIEVVRVNFDDLPEEALRVRALNKPAPPQVVRSSDEAAHAAGFVPRLPRPGILSGMPQLSVLGPMSFGANIKAVDLESALRKAGVSDEAVPGHWEGAQLLLRIGPAIMAEWNDVALMQCKPLVLAASSGVEIGAFTTLLLRALGMSREAAQRFGHRMTTAPALLLGIGTEDAVNIRDVNLRTGPATLIEDFGDNGRLERVTILWAVPDRVYVLSAAIRPDLAISLANEIE